MRVGGRGGALIFLLLAGSWALLAPAAASARDGSLRLSCSVDGDVGALRGDFEPQFCSALADYIERDLHLNIVAETTGQALEVRLTVRSSSAAQVQIASGHFEAGQFRPVQSSDLTLHSADSDLVPDSARTLIRPIGLLLGLL